MVVDKMDVRARHLWVASRDSSNLRLSVRPFVYLGVKSSESPLLDFGLEGAGEL